MKLASLLSLAAVLAASPILVTTVSADSKSEPTTKSDAFSGKLVQDATKVDPPKSSLVDSVATNIGTTYCTSVRNSTGRIADLTVFGSAVAAEDSVALHVEHLPAMSYGVFLAATTPGFVQSPLGSSGNICVRRDIGRFDGPGQVKKSGLTGTLTLDTTLGEWTTAEVPAALGSYPAMAGIRTHFQLWYRDTKMGTSTSNFSDAEYVDWL